MSKTLISKIIVVTLAMVKAFKAHPANVRLPRFDKAVHASYRAVGWFPKTDELTGTVDRPVVTKSGLIVRGLARLCTIAIGLESEEKPIKDFYAGFIATGGIEILEIPDNLPAATFRRIASDSDASKTAWNRAEAFRQWRLFVEEDGISPANASMLVGHTARRQTYEELLKCPPALVDAWIKSASGVIGAPYIKDSVIQAASKAVTAFRAMEPDAAADVYGADVAEITDKAIAGEKTIVAKFTATRQEVQDASAALRTIKRSFSAIEVADLLLLLAGYKGKTLIDDPKMVFAREIRKLVGTYCKRKATAKVK